MQSAFTREAYAHWADLVEKIRQGDSGGMEDLYVALRDAARPRLCRHIGQQAAEDRLHEILVIVLEAIRGGELRDPERLMGFVETVTRRRVAAHIRGATLGRRRLGEVSVVELAAREGSPEAIAAARERIDAIGKVMGRLRTGDREILVRFYLKEESPPWICREMSLTPTQFRLRKSRALARCLELANRSRRFNP